MDWIYEIASKSVLNQVYPCLCERRLDYSPNDDVWDLRWRREELHPKLQEWLRARVYRIGAVITGWRRDSRGLVAPRCSGTEGDCSRSHRPLAAKTLTPLLPH